MTNSTKRSRIDAWGNFLQAFSERPMTRSTAKAITGFSHDFITDLFVMLEDRNIIHYVGMVADSRGRLQVQEFAWGPGPGRVVDDARLERSRVNPVKKLSWPLYVPPKEVRVTRRKPLAVIPKAIREVATTE